MSLGDAAVWLSVVSAWVAGIAVVKGFWLTALCVVFPPAAWVELAMFLLAKGGVQ